MPPDEFKNQRFLISAQKSDSTQLFFCLSAGCWGSVRTTNSIPFWYLPRWSCAWYVPWNILSPSISKCQRFPISAQKAVRTTFEVSLDWLPGQCKNYQPNSFLALSLVSFAWCMFGTFYLQPSPKIEQIPISAQKAGRTTFVVPFSWLPTQCKNYQQNCFLAPSPGELSMSCVWNISSRNLESACYEMFQTHPIHYSTGEGARKDCSW